MASLARKAFDENVKDIERLLELHNQIGGNQKGRRYGLEVLNKSAIVLITAFWEAYCEDVASEGLAHIVKHAKSADVLPKELKKLVAAELKKHNHELALWKIADDGWRKYLGDRLEALRGARDRKLNTPKTANIDALFLSTVGIEQISKSWHWPKKMRPKRASEKLDKFVELRGAIAHRGQHSSSVTKAQVKDYFEFVCSLAAKTGGKVDSHVKVVTGKPLWTRQPGKKTVK